MDLTIQIKIFENVKYRHVVYLKFGDKFFTSPTWLWCQGKTSIFSAIKETQISYCRKFSVFVVAVIN